MSRSSRHPIPLKGPLEQDALTGWRHAYKYLGRSKVRKVAKRTYNRRVRRTWRAEEEAQ
ncbi:hypothetical protein ACH0CA_01375 [Kytococcus sedentarius]|uniref:hypothetical protein n=1 Tax=Kytococcus sedentarius TaxID=1276 RepID=UPI003879F0CB